MKTSFEILTKKVNQLISSTTGLDLALCLIANDNKESLEIRMLASQFLTQDKF
jgi:hypothetical protein